MRKFAIGAILVVVFLILLFLQVNIFPIFPIAGIVPNLFIIFPHDSFLSSFDIYCLYIIFVTPSGKTYSESVFVYPLMEMWKISKAEGLRICLTLAREYAAFAVLAMLHIKPSVEWYRSLFSKGFHNLHQINESRLHTFVLLIRQKKSC